MASAPKSALPHLRKRSGRSRHGETVWKRHGAAFRNCRMCAAVTPGLALATFPGSMESSHAHLAASTVLSALVMPHARRACAALSACIAAQTVSIRTNCDPIVKGCQLSLQLQRHPLEALRTSCRDRADVVSHDNAMITPATVQARFNAARRLGHRPDLCQGMRAPFTT